MQNPGPSVAETVLRCDTTTGKVSVVTSGSRAIPSAAMPNLHIRGVPPEVHERLKAQAAAEGRSVNDHLVRVLTEAANRVSAQEWFDRLAARAPKDLQITTEDIVAGIREDRRERLEELDRRADLRRQP